MAILALPPIIRSRVALKQVIENVPEIQSVKSAQKLDTRKFTLIMASIITLNLLVIAGINLLMTQDAFTLQRLKSERNIALDKKDAILNIVNKKNSPANLAKVAEEIGMVPATKIGYLNYSQISNVVMP
ncbi:MAG: hypothetical protein F2586_00605 [Actinobacteria bacterium]|uniref:Unannotated protein n=1 Tax=freshwater metagenome TaxID=449393 RepID=A0A6J6GGJ6_9ZZZZ|nr:hypothetical protein [Actinomycetota bacterium]